MEQEIANSHIYEVQLIEAELLRGSGFQDGKNRIYEFALTNPTSSVFATFLKEEYGTGGHSSTIKGMSFIDHDAKGIRFDWTDENQEKHEVDLTWAKVAVGIQKLVDEGRYHESQQLKPKDEQISLLGEKQTVENVRKPITPKVIDMSQKLLPIYNQCLEDVKSNWVNYLNCATNVHNHNFTNQVMIFGQSQDYELIADEKTWNKLGRYVNFNAEYITTIATKSNVIIEHKLYDISQTYGNKVDVDVHRFILDNDEAMSLNTVLSNKYKIKQERLKDTIQTLVAGIYKVNPVPTSLKKYERLIKNSVYYIVCKKLDILPSIDCANKFREIQSANLIDISLIGKSISITSQKLLNEIEKNLIEVRSNNYGRENNNEQQRVHSGGRGLVQKRKERNTLQTGTERDFGNSDTSSSDRDSTAGGQLSFGQIRETADDIHGREPRGQILGVDNSRVIDEEASREGGTTHGYENIIDGANREEKSSSDNGRFLQSSEPHGMDTISSGGNGEGGTLHSDLTENLTKIFDENIDDIIVSVLHDDGYFNALQNSDEQNIKIELDSALQRVFLHGYIEDDIELYRAYIDNPLFKEKLFNNVFNRTYEELNFSKPQANLADKYKNSLLIGSVVDIDERKFKIENVDFEQNSVELQDVTFKESMGYPIFRKETTDFVYSYIEKQELNKINFHYHSTVINNDSAISYGGAKTKYKVNIEAIKLLKQIESEDRLATAEEQYTLARYTGFGGISQAFDSNAKSWENEYNELKELLTPAEYEKARESTLTAYYTEPMIIKAMYQGLFKLGVDDKSKILEPSMGVGNFFGMLPNELQQCELHGVELDDLTGRLAKQLYQNADIQIKGYQDTMYQDNLFDASIGNVPFGDFKVSDDKHSLLVHDFFFAKTIDKVKPNGVISFISSKGTLDKANSTFRKYMAQRAELIGAVRLPNTAFKAIAGTEATTDIIFLRKREKQIVCEPEWVHVGLTENNVPVNQYYIDNPQNLLGEMVLESSQFGQSAVLKPFDDFDLYGELEKQIVSFAKDAGVKKTKTITKAVKSKEQAEQFIDADSTVKNYSYTIIDDNIYYRENDTMSLCDFSGVKAERVKGLHQIRTALRAVIDIQLDNYSELIFEERLINLNEVYDGFVKKYGYINDKVNKNVFEQDSDIPLLMSIEDSDTKGNITKTKIFAQATIRPKEKFVPKTYDDLITLSMSMKGHLDIEYMADNFNCSQQDVIDNLKGKIYFNPIYSEQYKECKGWETADEYLTGNVKSKLEIAKLFAQTWSERYNDNVKALENVQPTPLQIDEIDYKLSSSWIDIKYKKQFMYEISELPPSKRQLTDKQNSDEVCLTYNEYTSEYTIYNKTLHDSVKTNSAYGTDRKPFFAIVEDTLNLKDCKVYDRIWKDDKEKQVLNVEETKLARQKQELVKNEFKNWVCSDMSRVQDIVNIYNERFNVYRPRTFDGSHLTYDGMSNEIQLREHQNNAVARCLYGGNNVLLGHVVGSGKTYTMVASAMELKRIGIANKPLFVVPNHLTEQWGSDFLKLYPTANILVATKKDFQPDNRKRFIGKICTGEYDAIIIGHSQFEKIPMSKEYIKEQTREQINEITSAIESMAREQDKRFTVKQLENQKKKLIEKMKTLDTKKKDDVITFEQTGVDHLFIDEAHYYKNCFVHTKMSNVAGVATTNAQKSFDMLMKSKYIANKNGGRGVIFATGTPISNSMTEMFVMQRYLQPDALRGARISYFDEWASTFGETQTELELKPEGSGYRMRTRFAKFYNLPELINMFSQVADIKVAEDLNLPVPKIATGKPIIVVSKPSDYVKEYIMKLSTRADNIRNGMVDPSEDNMLKITGEGKAVAIDARLVDPNALVDFSSKIYKCCDNIHDLYLKTNCDKGCQLVFLDTGLMLYKVIKDELINKGINSNEVAFIHDAKTEDQKAELFAKCRNGDIRVLLGSTMKMGAGTNIQERLISVHHLDCPWRPADIEQRDGRILRQGNMYDEVYVYRYVTENTFDAYLWGIQESKQKFIKQIITNKSAVRSCDDVDGAVLDCAEVKMLATGDSRVKDKMQLDNDVYMLQIEKSAYVKERIKLQKLLTEYPQRLENANIKLDFVLEDIKMFADNKKEDFRIELNGINFNDRVKASDMLGTIIKLNRIGEKVSIGSYCGFKLIAEKSTFFETIKLHIKGKYENTIDLGGSDLGNITRLENGCANLEIIKQLTIENIENLKKQLIDAEQELAKPFIKEIELQEKIQKQVSLNSEMELDMQTQIVMKEDDENGLSNQVNTHDEEENEM